MSSGQLLRKCESMGIRLHAQGERLRADAPVKAMTLELRQALAEHKADLLALLAMRERLVSLAHSMGIPRTVVDNLPVEELEATVEQVALAEGHRDGNGDPLVQSLLVFYVRCLAQNANVREVL